MKSRKGREYSDEELGLIVQRASQLQDQASETRANALPARTVPPSLPRGLTLQAVKEIAGEVGVEARFVDQAAASLLIDSEKTGFDLVIGGPIIHEVLVPFGGALARSELAEVVDLIRTLSGGEGEVREVLGSVEWRSVDGVIGTKVTVETGEEGGTVRVRSDASGLAALTWIGSGTAGVIAAGFAVEALQPGSTAGVVAILGTGGGIGAGLARSIWSRATRALRHRSERLRDELARHLTR